MAPEPYFNQIFLNDCGPLKGACYGEIRPAGGTGDQVIFGVNSPNSTGRNFCLVEWITTQEQKKSVLEALFTIEMVARDLRRKLGRRRYPKGKG